jgi:transposase-like protein
MRKNNAKRAKIVAAINAGQMTTSEIAREFGTTYQYVYSIKYAMKGKELASDSTEEQLSLPLDGELPPAVVKLRAKLDAQSVGKQTEAVNHPPHYTAGGIETIDFIEAKNLNFRLANVVKYVSRASHKGKQLEDLRKAQWYLSREIMALEAAK